MKSEQYLAHPQYSRVISTLQGYCTVHITLIQLSELGEEHGGFADYAGRGTINGAAVAGEFTDTGKGRLENDVWALKTATAAWTATTHPSPPTYSVKEEHSSRGPHARV